MTDKFLTEVVALLLQQLDSLALLSSTQPRTIGLADYPGQGGVAPEIHPGICSGGIQLPLTAVGSQLASRLGVVHLRA
jgi:hypothetical protein